MFNAVRIALPAAVLVAAVAACGGTAAPTARPTATAGQPTATAGETASPTGAVVASAICRTLDNLTNLDYAFGKPFTIVQNLDAASKALTLQHLVAFAASAPPELTQAATDLVALWTEMSNDPSSVSESDPRWASAAASISAWRDANC